MSTDTDGSVAGKPARLQEPVLYSSASPSNEKIARDAKVDRRSKRLIRSFRKAVARQEFVIARRKWTVPVHCADAGTPRRSVRLTAQWREAKRMTGVPIPEHTTPDPGDDGEMAIVDRSTGCEYGFCQAGKRKDRWSASWANSIRTDGNGIPPAVSPRAAPVLLCWPGRSGHRS